MCCAAVITKMGNDGGLRALVLTWAKENEERCIRWLEELSKNDIDDLDDLATRAKYDDTWEELTKAVSGGLRAELREWFESAPELEHIRTRKRNAEEAVSIMSVKRHRLVEEAAYKPIKVAGINDYKTMLGKDLIVENASILWSDSRKELNQDNKVLFTPGNIEFIDFLKTNFVDGDPKCRWDGMLMKGISGSGKSVSFALGASYLDSLGLFDVYWFRNGNEYRPDVANYLETPINRDAGERMRIIFIDQADKLGNLDLFIGTGSENRGIFTLGCASGNSRVQPSSSRATRIVEYLASPSVDFVLFKSFFGYPEEDQFVDLPEFGSTRKMLDREVLDFPSLYIGTCGHFLSMARIRKHFVDHNKEDFCSAWNFVLNELSQEMLQGFSEEKDTERAVFYSHLHKAIFVNSDLATYYDRSISPDNRYIHNDRLFSPLFAQAYRVMLLSRPPPRALCASLRNFRDSDNPSIRGFCIERFVIDQISTLESHLVAILPFGGGVSTVIRSGTYCYGDSWTMPDEILEISDTFRRWIFLPLRWNERDIDAAFVFTYGKHAAAIGIQITLGSAAKHSSSLFYFESNEFERQLLVEYDVYSSLVFVCNRDTSNLSTSIQQATNKDVYDFPLFGIVDDALDDTIIKGHGAAPSCRKLQVNVQGDSKLSSCTEIKAAKAQDLRNFCRDYGGISFPKTPNKGALWETASSIHKERYPCDECPRESEKPKIDRLLKLK